MGNRRDIIVIGMSAGGVDALKKIVKGLPSNFPASIFVVWHIAKNGLGILPTLLEREGNLPARNGVDGGAAESGVIYTAPPDYHLLIDSGRMRLTRGPKENRFRPAIDPLFRSAACAHNTRVIGVILSGGLDDGTAGLWTVKDRGGIAVVQDPFDAEESSMPQSALENVRVDHLLPAAEIAELLVRLTGQEVQETNGTNMAENKKTEIEVKIAGEDNALKVGITEIGTLSELVCPECGGVLLKIRDGGILRFRCHTGHAYSQQTMLDEIDETIEKSLRNTIRVLEENKFMLNHLIEHFQKSEGSERLLHYKLKLQETEAKITALRRVVTGDEMSVAAV